MPEITRRQALGVGVAAAAAAGIIEPAPAEAEAAAPEASQASSYKFRLAESPVHQYSGGTKREVKVEQFPASPAMSGAIVTLEPGGMREPHWHPNCIEWDYVLAGQFRFNVVNPEGKAETFDVAAGDIVVVPQGFAHYFENLGATPATLLLTFNAGHFQEIGISEWVARTPRGVFEVPLNLPGEALAHAPDRSLFVTSRKTPGQ